METSGNQESVQRRRDAVVMLCVEIIIIVLFGAYGRYDVNADARTPVKQVSIESLEHTYPMFQDVHVMIFMGFGFLMAFLKKYGYSSTGYTLLLGAIVIQWALLCRGFFRLDSSDNKIHIGVENILGADIAAATVLISMGAVLGKTSPLQLVIMGFIEIIVFSANEYLGVDVFKSVDAGGSMVVHVFGAYFGLAVSMVLRHGKVIASEDNKVTNEGSSYISDLFSILATVFLWLFWPSFNAGTLEGDGKHRAVINTYLSLSASVVTTFIVSALVNKNHKYDMVHVQNATLAGGVAIGTVANLMIQPYGAILIGAFAGAASVAGYRYLQPYLLKQFKLHDTCGVHNLHGMPGVISGICGAIVAGTATEADYNYSLYTVFPARMPPKNTSDFGEYQAALGDIEPGEGRSAAVQAGYQLLTLLLSFLIAMITGAITGFILKIHYIASPPSHEWFSDSQYWELPECDEQEDEENKRNNATEEMKVVNTFDMSHESVDTSATVEQ